MTTFEHFLKHCVDFVRTYPNQNNRYQSLQGFALVEAWSDINADNLNKSLADMGKPFFYSKLWERVNYNPSMLKTDLGPLFIMVNEQEPVEQPFGKQKRSQLVEMAFIEPNKDKCECNKKCNCKARVINELYINMNYKAHEFLDYLKNSVVTNDGITHKNFTDDYLRSESNHFQIALNNLNPTINMIPWSGGLADFYGYTFTMNIPIDECIIYNPVNKPLKTVGTDKGCK